MECERRVTGEDFERFRGYLSFLVETRIRRGAHRFEADDVVQETLAKAYEHREQLKGRTDDRIACWLRTILANTLKNMIRDEGRQGRDPRLEHRLDDFFGDSSRCLSQVAISAGLSPSSAAARKERGHFVADALLRLPAPQREVLVLQHWHDLKIAEIAAEIGRTPAAVASLLRRGLGKLRAELKAFE
jgi:RNA polymerase sigma-70 factor (ECF subfamily)